MSVRDNGFLPWRDLMQAGIGVLGWSPEEFWRATPLEFEAAEEGYFIMLKAKAGNP